MEMAAGPKFKLDGLRKHKMLTGADVKALPPLGSQDGKGDQAIAPVKYFCPFGRMTLYVTEFDGEDTLFGYMVSPLGPDCDEWGYSSLAELAEMTIFGGVPAIERDCYFEPKSVAELIAGSG
jgi:Protein of unknown function (DUF2958)